MKKNNMLRIASVLLVAVLLSTCAISGVFAKYATEEVTADDSARVAQFGITLTAANATFFDDVEDVTVGEQTKYTVKGASGAKVVAPGKTDVLSGGITITDENREVAVKLITEAELTLEGWEANGYYCPLEIKIAEDNVIRGTSFSSMSAFAEAVSEALSSEVTYYVGDPINATLPAIECTWVFETGNDAKDTTLGTLGAMDAPTVALEYTFQIVQVN